MTTRMLIDAAHPEETRVVVLRGNRVEEFDFESANRRPLRGNIYLAKVTRVEPSLQAAFVDFGGNRHGFLAFSEIHPDYYQIPVADRMALLEEEAEAARREDGEDEEGGRRSRGRSRNAGRRRGKGEAEASVSEAVAAEGDNGADAAGETDRAATDAGSDEQGPDDNGTDENGAHDDNGASDPTVEQLGGGGDAMEEVPMRSSHRTRRQYKIQEVIKRRQILLVQVVKEERGTKGAALTTYLSLAGRYSVLMPNTARGGGISRKITSSADRKRLKELASDLEVPEGMGVILRTAGASRTKVEIKRDFEYLMRLWESVRSLTLESTAPALVYEEGSLIKRAIRDLYSKDIEDIQVAGDDGYREAKDFMRMLMPSHAKFVQPYKDSAPVFSRFGVESQLDAMFSNVVTLKSGGYIVINPTEALVSIDVNSGRSTREHNIEDTAFKTNLEAAEEVARQLRLRDLAGLIVIDFIDMEENRNNKAVERKLNECLKNDRARIQVGRISHFGLLEMSRQRIRSGVLESSTTQCPHCGGSGLVRSTPSLALHVLRALEETLLKSATHDLVLRTRLETAFYVLNQKRETLRALEARFGVSITVVAEGSLPPGQHFLLERGEPAQPRVAALADAPEKTGPRVVHPNDIDLDALDETIEDEAEEETAATGEPRESDGERGSEGSEERKRRRRRRRRGGRNGDRDESRGDAPMRAAPSDEEGGAEGDDEDGDEDEGGEESPRNDARDGDGEGRKRRRRRRGGRRNRRGRENGEGFAEGPDAGAPGAEPAVAGAAEPDAMEPDSVPVTDAPAPAEAPMPAKPRRSRARKTAEPEAAEAAPVVEAAPEAEEKPVKKPARGRKKAEPAPVKNAASEAPAPAAKAPETKAAAAPAPAPVAPKPAPEPEPEIDDPNRPKRSGWWSRAKQALGG